VVTTAAWRSVCLSKNLPDHKRDFVDRCQIVLPEAVVEKVRSAPVRDGFPGLDLKLTATPPMRDIASLLRQPDSNQRTSSGRSG